LPVRREAEGASAGGQFWGLCKPDEGVRPLERHVLPCSPPRSRSLRLPREREAGGRDVGGKRMPHLPPDASGLPVQFPPPGLHRIGESADEARTRQNHRARIVCPPACATAADASPAPSTPEPPGTRPAAPRRHEAAPGGAYARSCSTATDTAAGAAVPPRLLTTGYTFTTSWRGQRAGRTCSAIW
jgi:hypothetical protein